MLTRLSRPGAMARLLPGLGLFAGVILAVTALESGGATSGANVTEYIAVRHILIAAPNGEFIIEEEPPVSVSAQFVVNQHTWSTNSLPVQVRYNSEGAPGGHDVPGIIQEAIGTWNASGSGFSFTWAGGSNGDTGSCGNQIQTDGVNTIRFENLSGLTLGQTCTIYPAGANTKLVEFDMQLDDDALWSSDLPVPGNRYDLPTTILHELGHAAGLGHSAQQAAVMYFQISAGQNKRVLTEDDLNGIQAAYPPTPTATSTPTATATATSTQSPPSPSTTASPTLQPPVPTSTPVTFRIRAPLLARD